MLSYRLISFSELITTNLILQEENFASFVVSVLVHKMRGGKGVLIQGGGGAYFKFWSIGGVLIRRGCLFKQDDNSRIYGSDTSILFQIWGLK